MSRTLGKCGASAALIWLLMLPGCAQTDLRSAVPDPQLNRPESEVGNSAGEGQISWQSGLYLDHPLSGRIWRSEDQQFLSEPQLMQELGTASYLLIGEKHDNPDHHSLELVLLRQLLAAGRVASVAFEMLDTSNVPGLEKIQQDGFGSLTELRDGLQWDQEGWDWDFYGPLIAASLEAGVPVAAANIDRAEVSQVYAEPLAPAIAGVLDQTAIERMNEEIDASHCNMLPPSQFPAMVRVQQSRDHRMASSLVATTPGDRLNVLVAGNYHVRRDLGVPRYLQALLPDREPGAILTVALLEVDPDSTDPADYLQAYSDLLPYDYVWFTPAISNEDYCAGFSR
ncbi:MAG: ChaN family lipoprotein [Gammaproteobacteria bacterium]|nr:ChaN family lipoprotein [Pseudomonadales bacterium]MCP5348296.1 ChaN family lipoprotein [Pseudomonadales bacterium]